MNMKPSRLLSLILILVCVACSGARIPTAKTAQSVSHSYFKKYGGKYSTSDFSKHNFQNVTINHIEEISYKIALVDTIVTFVDGHAARTLLKMEKKFPKGWTVKSWEVLEYR